MIWERAFQKIGQIAPTLPRIHNTSSTLNPDLLKSVVEMCELIIGNFISWVKQASKGPG